MEGGGPRTDGRSTFFYFYSHLLLYLAQVLPALGIAIEGGSDTPMASFPRIIAVQPFGAAFQAGGLRVGQLVQEVDGISLEGLPHVRAARILAERYALKDRRDLVLVVRDHRPTPADRRRACLMPQS